MHLDHSSKWMRSGLATHDSFLLKVRRSTAAAICIREHSLAAWRMSQQTGAWLPFLCRRIF